MTERYQLDVAESVPRDAPPSADDDRQFEIEAEVRTARNSLVWSSLSVLAWAYMLARGTFPTVTFDSICTSASAMWAVALCVWSVNRWAGARGAAASRRRNLAKWTDAERARWVADKRRNRRALDELRERANAADEGDA